MIRLPAISLWQPWASLWVSGVKVHETRSWPFPKRVHGQRILVHAAQRADWPEPDDELDHICARVLGAHYRKTLARGAFVGTVVLQACARTETYPPQHADDYECGDWSDGRWAWRAMEPVAFAAGVEAKGRQGWWTAEIDEARS